MQLLRLHTRLFLVLVGTVVTIVVYLISGWARVSSVMHAGAAIFSVSYLAIVFLGLFVSFEYLKRAPLWRGVLTGAVIGYMAGLISYFATVLMTPYWAERSFHMVGWTSVLMIMWIPIALHSWTCSAVGFLMVSGLSKRL